MRFHSMLTFTAGVAVLGGSILVACQNYEFDKVTPKAIGTVKQPTPIAGVQKPPKIMLVIDKSGSMKTLPNDDTKNGCCETTVGECVGYSKDPSAVCKWNSVKSLMNGSGKFLDSTAGGARIGLSIFPNKDASTAAPCMAGSVLVEVPGEAGGTVSAIKTALESIAPYGGTPTASMLKALKDNTEFMRDEPATKRYVVLITDGLPNCNPQPQTCTDCTNANGVPPLCTNPINCVDETPVIAAVQELKSKGVETFVIGFGKLGDSESVALRVLNAAADAGGRPSGDPATHFYLATSDADLEKVLEKIKALIQPCAFTLSEAPSAEAMLEVTVAEKDGDPAIPLERCTGSNAATCNWEYNDPNVRDSIKINDTKATKAPNGWCSQFRSATPNTYTLNFMIVKELK